MKIKEQKELMQLFEDVPFIREENVDLTFRNYVSVAMGYCSENVLDFKETISLIKVEMRKKGYRI